MFTHRLIKAPSDNVGQRHDVLSCPYLDCRGDQKLKPHTHGWSLHVWDLALDRVQKAQCIHDGKTLRKVLKFCTRFLALGFLALGRSAICVNLKLPKKPSLFMIWPGPKAQRMGCGLGASQVPGQQLPCFSELTSRANWNEDGAHEDLLNVDNH